MIRVCAFRNSGLKMASGIHLIPGALLVICLACVPCIATNNSCVDLGFSSNLLCSSCRELREFKLEELEADCSKCCQADGEESDQKVTLYYKVSVYMACGFSTRTISCQPNLGEVCLVVISMGACRSRIQTTEGRMVLKDLK